MDDADLITARSSPAGLAWIAGGKAQDPLEGWVPFDHLLLLNDYILRVASGDIPRLIVTMPPRHGKSELISRYTPAWYLGTYPDRKVMLASYEHGFASSWGRKARDVLNEYGQSVWNVSVSDASARMDFWELQSREGVMVTAGVGGGLTGKGAHLLIIDDPVKNSEQASSQTIQAKAWDWWISTARTRLQRGAGVIVVMTRWHELDLAGKLLEQQTEGGDKWEVLNLPAIAESDDDALGREPGDALCPELFDAAMLDNTRQSSGAYWWSAMYQQRPMPSEGGVFKRADFRYADLTPEGGVLLHDPDGTRSIPKEDMYRFLTIDPALSEKETADYTAIAHWAVCRHDGSLILLDMERLRFDQPKQQAFIEDRWRAWQPHDMGVEDKAHGTALLQHLANQGYPVFPLKADTDKVTRARGAVARYEMGRVYHRRNAHWLDAYENELLAFPNGAHDDQVDCFSYAALRVPSLTGVTRKAAGSTGTETGGLMSDPL